MNRKDWNELIRSRKKVKSSDHHICGNVMAEYKDKIIIIEGDTIKSHEYIIPKSRVDHYDKNDLYLNISRHDMAFLNSDIP
ncbi:MAG TPA: hypothetical protein VFJ51_12165 [Nitrososphaeraceae archaeon]|nr:hypothetical protein [Nitrososphaeraceae archaeon]